MTLRELFKSARQWTKRAYARDHKNKKIGRMVDECGPDAVCWCLVGGLRRCYPDPWEQTEARHRLVQAIAVYTGREHSIPEFNDSVKTRFKDIRAVIEKAQV